MSKNPVEDQKKLRRRLSRLGGKAHQREKTPALRNSTMPTERLGQPVETPHGTAFVLEERFPLDHRHGNRRLKEYFSYQGLFLETL